MLTITPPTEIYTGVKNPILWGCCSDNVAGDAGTAAYISIPKGEGELVEDDYFTLVLAGQQFTFTLKDVPANCNEIDSTNPLSLEQLKNYILSQRFIALNYNVTVGFIVGIGEVITITAKVVGIDTSIYSFYTSNSSFVELAFSSPGADKEIRDVKILADIETIDGLLATLSGVPDTGCVEYNLEEYLRSIVSCPTPENGGTHRIAASILKTYTLTFWEQYNGNTCAKASKTTRIAWNGGTANEFLSSFQPTYLYFVPDPYSQDPFERKFLTNAPITREAYLTNLHWLYWYVTETSATMHCKITYADGENETFTKSLTGLTADTVYAFRTDLGYWSANVLSQSQLLVEKMEFWITDSAISSEHRFMTKMSTSNPVTRHFAFCNSLGGLDFFTTKNYAEKAIEVTAQETLNTEHKLNKDILEFSEAYSTSTGCISKETANWLEELYISDDVYIDINGSWVSVLVQDVEKTLWKDRRGYYQLDFTYRIAYENKAVDHKQQLI